MLIIINYNNFIIHLMDLTLNLKPSLAQCISTGPIYFHWPNIFPLAQYVPWPSES